LCLALSYPWQPSKALRRYRPHQTSRMTRPPSSAVRHCGPSTGCAGRRFPCSKVDMFDQVFQSENLEVPLRLGFFVGVLAAMTAWEMVAPR